MLNLEGRELGGCKLLRKIGAGGMGEVYLGEQRRVGNRSVAIKVVSPDSGSGFHPEIAADMEKRFQREVALLGNLSHPNILPVYDSGVENSLLYLVMQYAPDGSLADAIKGAGRLKIPLPAPLPVVADVIGQIADALQYTHDHGVVHRDVKPANVLMRVDPDGRWRMLLADFGVARSLETASQRTQVTGTFVYMAPEQFHAKFSPASDQYALGIMAFQLLAGRPPFEGDLGSLTRAHMYDTPPAPHSLNPAIPEAVSRVILRALAKEPAERYPSVAAFASALRDAAAQTETAVRPAATAATAPASLVISSEHPTDPVRVSPAPLSPPVRESNPVRLLMTAVAAVVLLAAVIGGTLFARGQQPQPDTTGTQTAIASATGTPTPTSTTAALGSIPTCAQGVTLQQGDDATCLPPAPTQAGSLLLTSASPLCAGPVSWTKFDNTNTDCPNGGGVRVTATAQNALGCVVTSQSTTADGYVSVYVTTGTGSVVIGVRQGQIASAGSATFTSTGYYLKLVPSTGQYVLYRIDAGSTTQIVAGALTQPLARHFVLGLLFKGGQFTIYINGQSAGGGSDVKPATTAGGFALCADGDSSATFQSAQLYQLAA